MSKYKIFIQLYFYTEFCDTFYFFSFELRLLIYFRPSIHARILVSLYHHVIIVIQAAVIERPFQ